MTSFEWLAVGYFAFVAATGPRTPRAARGWTFAAGAIALVIVARFTLPWAARAWLPHAYLVLGYWIPAAFTPVSRDDRFERWLSLADARLKSQIPSPKSQRSGFPLGCPFGIWDLGFGIFELAYLLCYPMVPAAFAVVYVLGDACSVERFWVTVLLSGYACYGTLPWTAARPPRLAKAEPPGGRVASLNAFVLGHVSHRLNTFPSGHVAVSIAAAVAVAGVSLEAGAMFGAVALAIAVAAVVGRYHYLVDVVLGLLLGLAAGVGAGALTGSAPCG